VQILQVMGRGVAHQLTFFNGSPDAHHARFSGGLSSVG